jgi:hypothetical protein
MQMMAPCRQRLGRLVTMKGNVVLAHDHTHTQARSHVQHCCTRLRSRRMQRLASGDCSGQGTLRSSPSQALSRAELVVLKHFALERVLRGGEGPTDHGEEHLGGGDSACLQLAVEQLTVDKDLVRPR